MNNLWKKETATAEYVDIFASVKGLCFNSFYFDLLKTKQTQKDNRRSIEWRKKGHEFFRQENWLEAMSCYNHSLCSAVVGSENVALAYLNRSVCFFNMRLYNEALADIELTKTANLPDRLIPRMEQVKNKSMKLMLMVEYTEVFEAKLDYDADKNFPCMANVVEIKYNEEFGRHLVAKCNIPAGRTVLVEKDFPRIGVDKLVCYTCSREKGNYIACPNCPNVLFCSLDCMNGNQTHKWECGSLFPHLEIEMRFHIKTILMAIDSFSSVDSLMEFVEEALLENSETLPTSLTDSKSKSKYHFFFKLAKSAPYHFDPEKIYRIYKALMKMPKVSVWFDSNLRKCFLKHLVLHHLQIDSTNSFGIGKEHFVANVCSLISHSCAPNVTGPFLSNGIFCVTGRPIKKGEQLFISYLASVKMTTIERKTKLESCWGFDCKCEKCVPMRKSHDQKQITSDPCYKYVDKNHHRDDKTTKIQKKCIKFLNKFGRTQWSSQIEFIFYVYERHLNQL